MSADHGPTTTGPRLGGRLARLCALGRRRLDGFLDGGPLNLAALLASLVALGLFLPAAVTILMSRLGLFNGFAYEAYGQAFDDHGAWTTLWPAAIGMAAPILAASLASLATRRRGPH